MNPRVPVGRHRHHGQTLVVTLEESSDPALYGRSFADVYDQWYVHSFDTESAITALLHLAADGPILELGVGTGRLALPLAQRGLRVVGLDSSGDMLHQLGERDAQGNVIAVLGDMSDVETVIRSVGSDEQFSLVFCAFNTLLNLAGLDEITRCLRGSRELVGPNGRVVIEAFVPIEFSSIGRTSLSPARVRSDAAVFIETDFDEETGRLRGRHIEVERDSVTVRPWSVFVCGPEQIDSAAHSAGLVLIDRWSDWVGGEFTEDSPTHVSIYAPIE